MKLTTDETVVDESYVVEVYLSNNNFIQITTLSSVSPTVIEIGISDVVPSLGGDFISGLIKGKTIQSVVLPTNIPSKYIGMLSPLTQYEIMYTDTNGLDIGAYQVKMGFLPDSIQLHKSPKPLDEITDGFHTFDYDKPEVDDGFHIIPTEGSLDDVVDGFHDVPLEKRDMWTEDPARMNRLSYLPIAAVRKDEMFPAELGGGSIR